MFSFSNFIVGKEFFFYVISNTIKNHIFDLSSMCDSSDNVSNSDQQLLQGQPPNGSDMPGEPCIRGPTPSRCDKAGNPYQLKRSKSFRYPSGSSEAPEHYVQVHGRSAQGIQICDEDEQLSFTGKRFRSGGLYGSSLKEEEYPYVIDLERYSGGLNSGRPGGNSRRVLANKPPQGKGVSRILKSARKTFAVCRGPNTKGPCSACKQLLHELESRDCFLAESESEESEGSSTEAIVDLCSSGDGEDLYDHDA